VRYVVIKREAIKSISVWNIDPQDFIFEKKNCPCYSSNTSGYITPSTGPPSYCSLLHLQGSAIMESRKVDGETPPTTGVGEDVGKKEPLYTAGGNAS
jgi:hypothetical protein